MPCGWRGHAGTGAAPRAVARAGPGLQQALGQRREDQADRRPQQQLRGDGVEAEGEQHVGREARVDDAPVAVGQRQRRLGGVVAEVLLVVGQMAERGQEQPSRRRSRRRRRAAASSVAFQLPNRACSRLPSQAAPARKATEHTTMSR